MADRDYPVVLNNLLQNHPSGNLSHNLHYTFTQEGPDNKATHIATAIYRGNPYGVGRGTSKSAARKNAAKATYEEFSRDGVPGTQA
ncbi:hypothetical protein DFH94DRAFT_232898 [Russula ochroleuca]|uniref:DRBM domain-containing protein n=1 Tax=Russula ochroleuca TaxID=152965 RepID=A0A9P5TC66_9AGAM|nr:hypothetical protein DFH94DRAFT_232898 [Russula ochroleuca]